MEDTDDATPGDSGVFRPSQSDFESTRVFGGSIALSFVPQTTFFSRITVRTADAEHKLSHGRVWLNLVGHRGHDSGFLRLKLASGGRADLSFSDHGDDIGDDIFLAHRQDAAKSDFSPTYALVESG